MTIKGVPQLIASLRKMGRDVEGATARAITEGLIHIDRKAKDNINRGTRSGETRPSGKHSTRTASAEGEYPKTDTGELVAGMFFGIIERNKNRVRGEVGSKAPHAKYLEYKPAAMGGRPWLSRTIREERKAYNDIIIRRLTQEIKK